MSHLSGLVEVPTSLHSTTDPVASLSSANPVIVSPGDSSPCRGTRNSRSGVTTGAVVKFGPTPHPSGPTSLRRGLGTRPPKVLVVVLRC